MGYNTIFYFILFFVIVEYLVQQSLSMLNRRAASPSLPLELVGLYDKEKYAEQQRYFAENNRFGSIMNTATILAILILLFTGLLGWLDEWTREITSDSLLWSTLLFFGILFLANELFSLPFEVYDTFVIEGRFGFNKTTPKTFIADQLKSLFVSLILGGVLLTIIVLLYGWLGHGFWVVACGVVVVFMLLLNMFYSQWIVPLFNKQTPLGEGVLRTEIENFAKRSGFCLDNIFVIDGSRRSTKANAYFSGLGSRKRVVLYDTLIDELTTEEIVAVLAHEALGGNRSSFALSLVSFSLLYTPIGLVIGVLINVLSRKNEYQADNFAGQFGLSEALVSGLKKITVKALSNLTPHPLYVKVYYSHPTLLQRIAKLYKMEKK